MIALQIHAYFLEYKTITNRSTAKHASKSEAQTTRLDGLRGGAVFAVVARMQAELLTALLRDLTAY